MRLESGEPMRTGILNLAEGGVAVEVVIDRTLPRLVVRHAPEPAVVCGAGIREQGDWIVRPYAGMPQFVAPELHGLWVVAARDQIGLDKRHRTLGVNQQLGEGWGRELAAFF